MCLTYVMCAAPLSVQSSRPVRAASELVLLGTGVSTALPRISCVLRGTLSLAGDGDRATAPAYQPCDVCQRGLADPLSPNRRGNVSALVRLGNYSVMIDCGKTARESCLRFFPSLGVRTVDAVVLTHGHADAILGLDDLRDIQESSPSIGLNSSSGDVEQLKTPVYLNEQTLEDCTRCFPYLTSSICKTPENFKHETATNKGPNGDIRRRVSQVEWRVFSTCFQKFSPISGVEFTAIPLLHGGDYICSGFVIRGDFENKSIVVYLSDVSEIPEKTMSYLQSLPSIDVLIVDSLLKTERHISHFSLLDAVQLARELKPTVTRCVGMTCSVGLHEHVNEELAKLILSESLDIQLGYDGQRLRL